jgi:hypothetical protein
VALTPRELARLCLSEAEAIVAQADAASRTAWEAGRFDALEAAAEAVSLAARAVFAIKDAQRTGAELAAPLASAQTASQSAALALQRANTLLRTTRASYTRREEADGLMAQADPARDTDAPSPGR